MGYCRTFSDIFDQVASRVDTRLAVRETKEDWSYAELLARSKGISRCLEAVCQKPGQRVGVMVPNSGAFVAAFCGVARIGGVIAPLSVRYRSQELIYYLKDTQPAALIVAPEILGPVCEALAQLKRPPALLEVGLDGSCRIVRKGEADPASTPFSDSAPLLYQYTSGSTGDPKRVIRTHANILFELERLSQAFDLGEDDCFLGAAPFSHVNGLVRTMMASMFMGATLYPVREFRRREILDLITQERITFFGGIPYMFIILAQTPVRSEVNLSSLRTVFSSSAPLLPDDNRHFQERYGIYVRQLYGSTETGTISVNLHPKVEQCLQSVGLPLEGIQVEILDEAGCPVPAGQEGEVAITSPAAIRAYDGSPEVNAGSFRDGFYLSGDLGKKNGEGYLSLTGRKKFMINRGGYKVNPREVEEAIQSHPKVQEVVVVGTPSPHGDEFIQCFVVTTAPCTGEELIRHCQRRIADFKIPSRIEFREVLPKSEAGKVLRQQLN